MSDSYKKTANSPDRGDLPRRRNSLRLDSNAYTHGSFFVTQATDKRQRLFGHVLNGRMLLNEAGRMIEESWHDLGRNLPAYQLDEFIVMPDHIHGIVHIGKNAPLSDAADIKYYNYRNSQREMSTKKGVLTEGHPNRPNLFDFVHRFKSLTTARYRHGVEQRGWRRFDGRVWQREYYEKIIRKADAIDNIRRYIRDNARNANLMRMGELRYYGNRKLLNLHKTAFLASRSLDAEIDIPRFLKAVRCVVSGFVSPLERQVLHYCRIRDIPRIRVAVDTGQRALAEGSDNELIIACRGVSPWAPSIKFNA